MASLTTQPNPSLDTLDKQSYAPSIAPSTSTTTDKPSKLSRLNPFAKSKSPSTQDSTPLVAKTEADIAAERKHKELIMKYRNMTEEEADAYIAHKNKPLEDGMGHERGLRALGTALAPLRLGQGM